MEESHTKMVMKMSDMLLNAVMAYHAVLRMDGARVDAADWKEIAEATGLVHDLYYKHECALHDRELPA